MRQFYHVLLLIFIAPACWAQSEDVFRFARYTTEDGLPSNTIYAMTQDKAGYLWIGTDDGLCRFDGSSFLYFKENQEEQNSIFGKRFTCIFEDHLGNIWAGTESKGINRIDAKSARITHFENLPSDTSSLSSNQILSVFEDYKNRLWVCTGAGLSRYDPAKNSFKRVLPFKDSLALAKYHNWQVQLQFSGQDSQRPAVVWLVAAYGLCRFNTDNFEAEYFFPSDLEIANRCNFMDGDGVIWVGDWGTGLYRFDTKTESYSLFKCAEAAYDPHGCLNVSGIFAYDKNRLLLAAPNAGLVFFDKNESRFQPVVSFLFCENAPEHPGIIFKDKSGNFWIGSTKQGLFSLQPHRQLFKKTTLPGHILKVLPDPKKEHIYACSQEGFLYVSDEKTGNTSRFENKNPVVKNEPGLTNLAFDPNGRLWVLGTYDLFTWNGDKQTLKKIDWDVLRSRTQSFGYNWDFVFDAQNQLWISAQSGGLMRLDFAKKDFEIYTSRPGESGALAHDFSIGTILSDRRGRLWGANQNGIFYFSKIKNQFINSPTPPLASGSQKPFVGKRQLAEDAEGNIWVTAGLRHLGRVSPNGDLSKPIELLKLDKNLPNIAVLAALINKNGDLWLGSTEGLTRIRLRTGQVTQYGKSYGIETVYGLSEAADGEIFAATQGGFYRFYPDKLNVEIKPPKPLIANFKVFDQPFTTKLGSIASEKIRLSHRQNFFSFEFSALDFSSNDEKEFAYMLEGLEADWVMAGSRRYAAYTNLWGSDYLFKMRVRNKYGDWSEPVTLPIYIVPPAWQRWWFWVMAALLATAIIYGIYRYRIAQIRREAALKTAFNKQLAEVEMKALRAQMNPHFLFNSLNAIKFYVLKKDKKKAAEYLTDFSRLIRLVLHNSSLQLISLEKELEALELYMRIEQLRFDEQFDFEIKIAPDVATDAFLLPPLLLQPYVENAIWHGLMHKKDGKGLLLVKVDKIENGFSCIIEDNGIGREKARQVRSKSASAQKSMGMSITRHRMDISKILTNTDFDVAVEDMVDPSGEAAGTRVVIRARFREEV